MSRDVVPINKRDPFWKDPFFSSSWDDFEATRQGIIAQNKDFWSNVDKGFEDFEEQVVMMTLHTYASNDQILFCIRFDDNMPTWIVKWHP